MIAWDLSQLPAGVRQRLDEFFRNDHAAALMRARIEQEKLAKFYRDNPPRMIEGLGEQTVAIHPYLWSYLRRGTRAAPGEMREVVAWLKKRYGELFRTRNLPVKTSVGYGSTPTLGEARPERRVRFFKVYGEKGREPAEPAEYAEFGKDKA